MSKFGTDFTTDGSALPWQPLRLRRACCHGSQMTEITRMNSRTILNVFASICLSRSIAGCYSNRAGSLTNRSLREIPVANESFSPKVIVRSGGSAILSWLEPQGDTAAALRFSAWRNEASSEPTTIAAAQTFTRHSSESHLLHGELRLRAWSCVQSSIGKAETCPTRSFKKSSIL